MKYEILKKQDIAPFMSIADTATYSGFSQNYIRNGCINGTIPNIRVGLKYMIDVNLFMEQQHHLAAV